jgi:hypothetical protein
MDYLPVFTTMFHILKGLRQKEKTGQSRIKLS